MQTFTKICKKPESSQSFSYENTVTECANLRLVKTMHHHNERVHSLAHIVCQSNMGASASAQLQICLCLASYLPHMLALASRHVCFSHIPSSSLKGSRRCRGLWSATSSNQLEYKYLQSAWGDIACVIEVHHLFRKNVIWLTVRLKASLVKHTAAWPEAFPVSCVGNLLFLHRLKGDLLQCCLAILKGDF